MRILAVDHGEKRIGVALSDPTARVASPLTVIPHVSRLVDAGQIAAIALEHEAGLIIVGQSFDEQGHPNAAGRSAGRFAEILRQQTGIPVEMWDESFSTRDAQTSRLELNISRKKRAGHQDAIAACIILQSYLEENMK